MSTADLTRGEPSPLEFPADVPVKVMGKAVDGFHAAVLEVVLRHFADFDPATVGTRPSRAGTYLSVTCDVHAHTREQVDALYRELTSHPLVLMVL